LQNEDFKLQNGKIIKDELTINSEICNLIFEIKMTQTHNTKKIPNVRLAEPVLMSAQGKKLGRLASTVAHLLMGKQYASYERHIPRGAKVLVTDAAKLDIRLAERSKKYHKRYSGYPGGLRLTPFPEVVAKKGMRELIRHAVYGMLPANRLRNMRMKNLTIRE